MLNEHDQRTLYCRKLGHHLPFSYCRQEHNGLPCTAVERCWGHIFDVSAYLQAHFKEEELAHLKTERPPKIASILEIVQNVQNQNKP